MASLCLASACSSNALLLLPSSRSRVPSIAQESAWALHCSASCLKLTASCLLVLIRSCWFLILVLYSSILRSQSSCISECGTPSWAFSLWTSPLCLPLTSIWSHRRWTFLSPSAAIFSLSSASLSLLMASLCLASACSSNALLLLPSSRSRVPSIAQESAWALHCSASCLKLTASCLLVLIRSCWFLILVLYSSILRSQSFISAVHPSIWRW